MPDTRSDPYQVKTALGLLFLGLRRVFRPALRAGLRVANGFRQHLAQLRLGLRWCPGDRCLPVCHASYVGMPEAELKPLEPASNSPPLRGDVQLRVPTEQQRAGARVTQRWNLGSLVLRAEPPRHHRRGDLSVRVSYI